MVLTVQWNETEVLGDRHVPMSLIHHKSQANWPGTEPGPPR